MTIIQMRELLNLSQTAFGEKYNIPMRTIQNWEGGQRKCPEYVRLLLERVVWEDYEEENGHVPMYSIEGNDIDATYDLHLGDSEDLEEAKKIARRFRDDGFDVSLVLTKEFLTCDYNTIEF